MSLTSFSLVLTMLVAVLAILVMAMLMTLFTTLSTTMLMTLFLCAGGFVHDSVGDVLVTLCKSMLRTMFRLC